MENVTALAVGIVDHRIEHAHPAEVGIVGVDERDRSPARAVGLHDLEPASRSAPAIDDVDQALARVSDDRNNAALTTEMAHIFDEQGQLNRRGAGFSPDALTAISFSLTVCMMESAWPGAPFSGSAKARP